MLLYSVRVKKSAVTIGALCLTGVFVAVCLLCLKLIPADTVTIGDEAYPLRVEDEDDIGDFLSVCGYKAEELMIKREITIPSQWDKRYEAYASLQREQGFSLERFKGDAATEFIFSLAEDGVFADILVSDSRIIAAHLSPMDGSGDIAPLILKEE